MTAATHPSWCAALPEDPTTQQTELLDRIVGTVELMVAEWQRLRVCGV